MKDSTLPGAAATVDPYQTHADRATWIGRLGILVSFSHMVGTIALFSDRSPWALFVAAANTLMIDLIIWALAEYLHFSRAQGFTPTGWAVWLFRLALVAAVGLNGGDLWAHRPGPDVIPGWASGSTVILFSLLIPGFIAGSSIIRGQLFTAQGDARTRAIELDQLRRDITRLKPLESLLERARAEGAQLRADLGAARAATEAARAEGARGEEGWRAAIEQARAGQAQAEAAIARTQAEARQALEGVRADLGAARAEIERLHQEPRGSIDLKALARALVSDHNLSRRAVATLLGTSDSTIRAWLAQEVTA